MTDLEHMSNQTRYSDVAFVANCSCSHYMAQIQVRAYCQLRSQCMVGEGPSPGDVHDTILQIYRCSVVWQHNIRIIIPPILLWMSCAGNELYYESATKDDELVRF